MCEQLSVSQAADLRREARRRKILENSASRLKQLECLNSSDKKTSSETFESKQLRISTPTPISTSKPEINLPPKQEVTSKISDIIKDNKELKAISDFLLKGEEEDEDDVEITEEVEDIKNQYIGVILEKRLHYLILAVVVNVMFFFNIGFLFYENIWCPFYTVKAIELISRGGNRRELQPLYLFFLSGLPQSAGKIINIILIIFSNLFSDLSLYVFTFVIGMKIINMEV